MVRNRERAEDITAAALTKAYANVEAFRGESSLHTWSQAIARNLARRQWRQPGIESIDGPQAREFVAPERLEENFADSQTRSRLAQALGRLPAKHRRALEDHFVHGYPIREMARREHVPAGTVLSRIFKAKRLIRRASEALP